MPSPLVQIVNIASNTDPEGRMGNRHVIALSVTSAHRLPIRPELMLAECAEATVSSDCDNASPPRHKAPSAR